MASYEAMDATTVAELLGVSPRMVNNYINSKGLPSEGSGKRRTFVWADVREWYVQYRMQLEMGDGSDGSDDSDSDPEASISDGNGKEDIRAANLRKTRAEANLKELQLGKLRGQVISIPDARIRLDRMMGNLRAKLLTLPQKLSARLEGEKTRTGREAALKEEIENVCREISTGAVVDLPAEPSDTEILDNLDASADRPADMTDEEYIQHLEDMELLYQTAYEVCSDFHPDFIEELSACTDPNILAAVYVASRPEALAELQILLAAARELYARFQAWKAADAAVE